MKKKCILPILLVFIDYLFIINVNCAKLEEKFIWKQLRFGWPSQDIENEAIASGKYIPDNNLPLGLEIWKDKLFVTVPRWKLGVASALNFIQLPTDNKSPILQPYPSWEANTLPTIEADTDSTSQSTSPTSETTVGRAEAKKPIILKNALKDNSTIISPLRLHVDECDRLWVMDTGRVNVVTAPIQYAPPAIVIFDLNTNQLIRRYAIPESNTKEDTFYINIAVDNSKDDCDNTFAYISDVGAYGVVVYSFKENKSWRIKHNFFHIDPLAGEFHIDGVDFHLTDGVFALALGSKSIDGERDVYFHSLVSIDEFMVSNKVLQNETYVTSPLSYHEFRLLGSRGLKGQASAEVYDKQTQVLFFALVNKNAIGCWNTHAIYNQRNLGIVDADNTTLVYANDMIADDHGNIFVLSNKLPLFFFRTLNPNEYNYRILQGQTPELIHGTPCAKYY